MGSEEKWGRCHCLTPKGKLLVLGGGSQGPQEKGREAKPEIPLIVSNTLEEGRLRKDVSSVLSPI